MLIIPLGSTPNNRELSFIHRYYILYSAKIQQKIFDTLFFSLFHSFSPVCHVVHLLFPYVSARATYFQYTRSSLYKPNSVSPEFPFHGASPVPLCSPHSDIPLYTPRPRSGLLIFSVDTRHNKKPARIPFSDIRPASHLFHFSPIHNLHSRISLI